MTEAEKKKIRRIRDICNELLGETQQKLITVPKKAVDGELHSLMSKAFDIWYGEEFKRKYTWQPKDRKGIKDLIGILRKTAKDNTEGIEITDNYILRMFVAILGKLKEVDSWVYESASPMLILSKINPIITNMLTGKAVERQEHKDSIQDRLNKPKNEED